MTHRLLLSVASLLSSLVVAPSVFAAGDTWAPTAAGTTYGWNDAANWVSTTQFPNGISDAANVNINLAGAQTILLNVPITVGTLNLGDSTTGFFAQTIAAGTAGSLTFDVNSGSAVLARTVTTSPGVNDTISAGITLNDSLNVRLPFVGASNGIVLSGLIGGAGGITLTNPALPSAGGSSTQILDVRNAGNSFTGGVDVGNSTFIFRGDALVSTDGGLGNSATAVKLGGVSSRAGSGTPSFANNTTAELRLQASDDTTNYTFARDLDLSGSTGNAAATGRVRFGISGNGAGGLNTNTLTVSGNVILPEQETGNARAVEFFAARQGQTIRFTGGISVGGGGTSGGATGNIHWGPSATAAANVDGPSHGTYRFSDVARTYTNAQSLTNGTAIVEGTVGAVGSASPIGTQTLGLTDGNGGNMFTANQTGANRRIFLDTPGSSFARTLGPGQGTTTNLATTTALQPLYGSTGNINIFNGYEFGGLNTSGTVTFSGNIAGAGVSAPVTGSAAGSGGTNVISVVNNIALTAATGGTVEFTGIISGSVAVVPGSSTPGATTNTANLTRITVNQFRSHPNLDSDSNGVPDAQANAPVGSPTGGTVVLSGASTYGGTTEVRGGTLEIGGASGSIAGSSQVTVSSATLKLSGSAPDRLKNAAPFVLNGAASVVLAADITESTGPLTVNAGASSLDFGSGTCALTFADSTGASWSGTVQVSNWSGTLVTGGGQDQLLFPPSGLTAVQLAAISFLNPVGAAPGTYPALQLASGEVLPDTPGGLAPYAQWQQDKFGADATNPAVAEPSADPDNDGLQNLVEYALLGEPRQGSPGNLASVGMSAGALTLSFQRETTRNDITIRIQSSSDLLNPWVDEAVSVNGAPFTSGTGAQVVETGTTSVKLAVFTDSTTLPSRRYLRIKVTQ